MKHTRPPATRRGHISTVRVGYATLEFTRNRWRGGSEIFCKYRFNPEGATDLLERVHRGDKTAAQNIMEALQAPQGYLDRLCTLISLALQGRASKRAMIAHLLGDKTWPRGIAGQPISAIDAIARQLQAGGVL